MASNYSTSDLESSELSGGADLNSSELSDGVDLDSSEHSDEVDLDSSEHSDTANPDASASSTANLDASISSTANLDASTSSTASLNAGEKSKTRKRVRREATWKSRKRIKLRNSGQAYTSVSNKQVSKNLLHKPDTVTHMQLHTYSAFMPLEFVLLFTGPTDTIFLHTIVILFSSSVTV